MQVRSLLLIVAIFMCVNSQLFSFGEPPEYDKSGKIINEKKLQDPTPKENSEVTPDQQQKKSAIGKLKSLFKKDKLNSPALPEIDEPAVVATPAVTVPTTNTEENRQDLEDRYFAAIKEAKYNDALAIINEFPNSLLNDKKVQEKRKLQLMSKVETDSKTESSDLFKAEELDVETERTVKRLYREAQVAYFNGENDLGKDLLIHILNVQRRNLNARKFLEYGWDLRPGMYTVEDMEAKYWRKSSISFYGGQYMEAVQSLNVLTHINNQNALVYERLGSSYYQLGETKKAIDAWKTALFLNPKNTDLPGVIRKAELVMKEEEKLNQERNAEKTKKTTVRTTKKTRLMSSFKEQTQAYSYAAELKNNGFNAFVEEADSGRWEVRIILGDNEQ